MSQKTVLKVGLPVTLLVAGAILLKARMSPEPKSLQTSAQTSAQTSTQSLAQASSSSGSATSVQSALLSNNVPAKTGAAEAKVTSVTDLKFSYSSELTTFANLRAKVFLKPEEKAERQRLLHNVQLVRSLEPLLKVPAAVGTDVGQMQNQALDLLLEAKAQGAEAAGEVLRAVVEDKTIENEAVDSQQRRLLAGLKAEVLFQWSAQEPNRAGDIERWLPGPVSQRIWQNVRDAQEQNFAESAVAATSSQ